MRRLLVAFALIGFVSDAFAGEFEMPVLRGASDDYAPSQYVAAPPTYTRWSGFYLGGQAGYGSSHVNFSKVDGFSAIFNPQNFVLNPLSDVIQVIGPASRWAKFGTNDTTAAAYGGFVGYNSQWDDAVLGIELNYNHTSLSASSSTSRTFLGVSHCDANSNCNPYNVGAVATASMKVRDYATIRGRGGWAFGNFLPYGTIGLVVGRADVSRSATATVAPTPTTPAGADCTNPNCVITDGNHETSVAWGYAAGLGVDVLLWSNMFLRAEYEFVQFVPMSHISANIHTVRAGAGFKF